MDPFVWYVVQGQSHDHWWFFFGGRTRCIDDKIKTLPITKFTPTKSYWCDCVIIILNFPAIVWVIRSQMSWGPIIWCCARRGHCAIIGGHRCCTFDLLVHCISSSHSVCQPWRRRHDIGFGIYGWDPPYSIASTGLVIYILLLLLLLYIYTYMHACNKWCPL